MLVGDFNFHIDRQTDCDAKRFVSILDSFDLVQHVAGPTHRDGHTLDLVITRASEKELVSFMLCWTENFRPFCCSLQPHSCEAFSGKESHLLSKDSVD